MFSRYQELAIHKTRISWDALDVRCLRHLLLALPLSFLWWLWIRPWPELVHLTANTVEFWFGLFFLILVLMARAARFFQTVLAKGSPPPEEHLRVWFILSLPYLLESSVYSASALLIGLDGGPDTLTTPRAGGTAFEGLLILATIVPTLGVVGATILGWKFSSSEVPAVLAILTLGSFTTVMTPWCYQLTELWIPRSFPLLQVCLVAVGGLLLLLCLSHFPGPWFTDRARPEQALLTSGLLPIAFPVVFLVVLVFCSRHIISILIFCALATVLTALAISPALLLAWLKPTRCANRTRLVCWAFLIGSLSHFSLALVTFSFFSPDYFGGNLYVWIGVCLVCGLFCAITAPLHKHET